MKLVLSLLLLLLGNAFGGESFHLVERVSIWHRDFRARYEVQISGAELMRTKAFNSIVSDGVSRFHDFSENVSQIEKHMKTGLEPRKIPKVDTVMICEIKLGKGAAYFYVSGDGMAHWIDDGETPVEPAVLKRTLIRLPVADYIDFLETFPEVRRQLFPDIDLTALRTGVSYTRGQFGRGERLQRK